MRDWPNVSRRASDISKLGGAHSYAIQKTLRKAIGANDKQLIIGLDFEFHNDKPHIIGLSDGSLNVSVPYANGARPFQDLLKRFDKNLVLVGHSLISSDLFVLRASGIDFPVNSTEDTIILWWLTNMHLCKVSQKGSIDDGDIKRGSGFMNLGAMASVNTSLNNWKECRGEGVCDGPCPEHDVFGYNGIDSVAPVLALSSLHRKAKLTGVAKLYPMHRELAYELEEMSRFGVFIDVPYIKELQGTFERDKKELKERFPFNPNSPKQVVEHFGAKGITLSDTAEETIRDLVEDNDDEILDLLLEYKEMGKGTDSWFGPKYLDKRGFVHPRIGFYTSSARMMCSSPNFHNVAKRRKDRRNCECGHKLTEHIEAAGINYSGDEASVRGCVRAGCSCERFSGQSIGKRIRRAIIAPEGYYIIRADYSNAENRVFLYEAGYDIPHVNERGERFDLHQWVVEIAGLTDDMPFSVSLGNAREAAKSIQHAGNYMEGLQLLDDIGLRSKRVKDEINAGARVIYPDWRFEGKTVSFTGINLARRAFGEATWDKRKEALGIAERYFGRFDKVRGLQQRITRQIETDKAVRPPHGYVTLSYGFAEDRMKTAAAIWGSQPVAHISKLALVDLARKFKRDGKLRPILQIHDEILGYCSKDIPPDEAGRLLRASMEIETSEMPGLILPAEASWGDPDIKGADGKSNWRDQKKLKL
jgi:hypothetical protein